MGKYRDKLHIVADILKVVNQRARKTQIMYQANLSYKLLSRYLEEVMNARLVSLEKGNSYVLTSKGEEFFKRCSEYHRQCEQLEEQISSVRDERTELEKMLLEEWVDTDDSSNQPKSQRLKKK